jgi:hypothetical protein
LTHRKNKRVKTLGRDRSSGEVDERDEKIHGNIGGTHVGVQDKRSRTFFTK